MSPERDHFDSRFHLPNQQFSGDVMFYSVGIVICSSIEKDCVKTKSLDQSSRAVFVFIICMMGIMQTDSKDLAHLAPQTTLDLHPRKPTWNSKIGDL